MIWVSQDVVHQERATPRYRTVAAALRQAIADGRFPVGSRLPTELALCEQYDISRFTARAAVRELESAGLVSRRQRVGTIVVASTADHRFRRDITSVAQLFQYAKDTELRLVYVGRVQLDAALARQFGTTPHVEWIFALGVRRGPPEAASGEPGRPFCITRVYLNPALEGIEALLRNRDGAIYSVIERHYGRAIGRVEQEIQAVTLDADDAANLDAATGEPALRIIRRYFDADGQLLEVADNIHPADRFSYRMQLAQ